MVCHASSLKAVTADSPQVRAHIHTCVHICIYTSIIQLYRCILYKKISLHTIGAWKWFVSAGVVTGEDFPSIGSGSTCKPYTFESCAHHVDPPAGMVACSSLPEFNTPVCKAACSETGYSTPYKADKIHAQSSYSIRSVEDMQVHTPTHIHIHHPAYYTFLNIYIYMLMTVGCGCVEGVDGAGHLVGGARSV